MTVLQIDALVSSLVMLFVYVFAYRRAREIEIVINRIVKENGTVEGSAELQRWVFWDRFQQASGILCVGGLGVLVYSVVYIG